MDPELTLEKAKRLVRQREAVCDQQHTLKREQIETSSVVDAMSLKLHQNSYKQVRAQVPKRCSRCGKNPHTRDACLAKDVTCRRCQKKGHFAETCRTKTVHDVEQDRSAIDSFYLDTIQDAQDSTFWTTDVKVNDVSITFKVDTGAEVTAISEAILKDLGSPEVNKPTKKLVVQMDNPCT